MMRSIAAATVAFVLLSPASGGAQDDYERSGVYVGVAGLYGIETFARAAERAAEAAFGGSFRASIDNSLGADFTIGYRFHPHYALEVEAQWLHGFDGQVSVAGLGTVAGVDFQPWVVTFNGKGYLMRGRYQPYLSLGLGAMTAELKLEDPLGVGLPASERLTDVTLRFGGGLEFYATENVVLGVGISYLLPFVDLHDFDFVSFEWGLRYRF